MSGKKQHYIPQQLLWGFSTPKGKSNQVWVFSTDKVPFLVGTHDVAAQRYFYSKLSTDGSQTLDDEITQFENGFRDRLADLRQAPIGASVDAKGVASMIVHLGIRNAAVRDFMQAATKGLTSQIVEKFQRPDWVRESIGLSGAVPTGIFRDELDKKLSQAPPQFRTLLERMMIDAMQSPAVARAIDHNLKAAGVLAAEFASDVQGRSMQVSRTSHQKALKQSLSPDIRVELLSRLNWTIEAGPAEGLILSDSAALSFVADEIHARPLLIASAADPIRATYLPISSDRVLIGIRAGRFDEFAPLLNPSSAYASATCFFGRQNRPEFSALKVGIGSTSANVLDQTLKEALAVTPEELASHRRKSGDGGR